MCRGKKDSFRRIHSVRTCPLSFVPKQVWKLFLQRVCLFVCLRVNRSVYYAATDVELLRPMVDVTWAPMLAAFSVPLDKSEDEVVTFQCLEGFRHAIHITSVLTMRTQRDAFITSLAKFTSLHSAADIKQKNIDAIKVGAMNISSPIVLSRNSRCSISPGCGLIVKRRQQMPYFVKFDSLRLMLAFWCNPLLTQFSEGIGVHILGATWHCLMWNMSMLSCLKSQRCLLILEFVEIVSITGPFLIYCRPSFPSQTKTATIFRRLGNTS